MVLRNFKCIYFLILFCFNTILFSQENDFIRGKLLDTGSGEPVVFATIRIKEKAIGVISNQDGGFRIPKKFKELGDILVISSMGYQKKEIPMAGLSPDAINVIQLSQGVMELSEAVVIARKKRRLSARRIVRKAIEAIPANYPQNSFSLTGYYRDYQLDQNNDYINLNEAILEAFDLGFDEIDSTTTKVKIYEYKKNTDFERDTLADDPYNYRTWKKVIDRAYLFNYGGNEFTILRIHDAVRNFKINSYDFVNQLEKDFLNNHFFDREDDVYSDDQALYGIDFRNSKPGLRISGKFAISKENYAIHKMEYAIYDTGNEKRKRKRKDKDQLIFKVVSEYKPKYGKMYLNYISFHNSFMLGMPPKFVVSKIYLDDSRKCFTVRFSEAVDFFSAKNKKHYNFSFHNRKTSFSKILPYLYTVDLYPDWTKRKFTDIRSEIDEIVRSFKLDPKNTPREMSQEFKYTTGDLHIYRARLDPDLIEEGLGNMFQVELKEGSFELNMPKAFSVAIERLKDVNGNYLNKRVYKEYKQFREFFVQQVRPGKTVSDDSLFMNNRRPIFENQPIAKPEDVENYWMNTPLQKTEN